MKIFISRENEAGQLIIYRGNKDSEIIDAPEGYYPEPSGENDFAVLSQNIFPEIQISECVEYELLEIKRNLSDVPEFIQQARTLVECFDNPKCAFNDCDNTEEALEHWLFEQDFFCLETYDKKGNCEVLTDAEIGHYMTLAGATLDQIKAVIKICHKED